MYELYTWNLAREKVNKHTISAKKSAYIKGIYNFVSDKFGDLKKYDGYRDLSGEMLAKAANDTATMGRVYPFEKDHGPIVAYKIKFGRDSITTGSFYIPGVYYHIEKFPCVGTLLLLLNIVYFKKGYFHFRDIY